MLEPYKHFIPVKRDLSDLLRQFDWCEANEEKCKTIVMESRKFHETYLSKHGIIEYTSNLLHEVAGLKSKEPFVTKQDTKDLCIAFIAIFRDDAKNTREAQRLHFIEIMNRLFADYDYKIFIIEQSQDKNKFNIGKLKNIGFEIASMEMRFTHYIFTDIDMIPDTNLMKYYLMVPPDNAALSLAIDGTRYHSRKDYFKVKNRNPKPFLGGVCSFTEEQFTKVNGYPNNIYGWGGEDDELYYRMDLMNLSMGYPKEGSVIDLEEHDGKLITNPKEKVEKLLGSSEKEKMRWEKINNYDLLFNENGVNNLFYVIEDANDINANTVQIRVALNKHVDENLFPQWFPDSMMTTDEIAKYKEKIRNIKWKIEMV